jgi:TonB-linked SusC/RagA family outer membrane protein
VGATILRVESIGYRSTEQNVTIAVDQPATVNFELQASAVGLDEIVVTGTAGRTTKRALGNSISTVKAAELTEIAPITNVQNLLQGRTPGVMMMNSAGVVGGSSRIRIRGSSSISANNEPVVYVDGIRVQSGTYAPQGDAGQGVSLLESFNPNDIESIEVIKGPAASTLYGAEAANGVIQIITKKGKGSEGLQWSASMDWASTEWAAEKFTNYWICEDIHIDNPTGFPGCQIFNKSMPRDQRILKDRPLDPKFRSAAVKALYEQNALAAERAGNPELAQRWRTQDYPCLFPQQAPCDPNPLRTGYLRNMNLSVRGGGDSFNFYVSGENSDETGSFYNNFNNRKGGRANFGVVASEKANFAVNLGYVITDQMTPQSDNSSNSILRNSFRGQAGGPASQYLPGFRNFSPEFSNKSNTRIELERMTMGLTGNYNPWNWFTNRLTVGMDRSDRTLSSSNQIDQTGLQPFGATSATGSISLNYNLVHLYTVDYVGTVSNDLTGNLNSALSGGMQLTKRRSESEGISGNGLVANSLNLVSSAANRDASQSFSEQTSLGFFVEEKVGFKERLFGTVAVRVDDNSAFGEDFSLVVYPKASVSYVISEEDFFNVGWVDELKLRAAWGQAGNSPAPFSADRTYSTGRAIIGDAVVNTLSPSDYGNPNLKAETGQEIEAGFDASTLKGRLDLNFSYYFKQTKDALLSVADPPSSGWSGNHLVNVGEVRNHGIDASIDAAVVQLRNFQWDALFSIGTNSNKLVTFGKDAQGNPALIEDRFGQFLSVQRHREGFPLGGYWATDVERDASGKVILNAAGQATPVSCVWDVDDPSLCKEEYLGPSLPTRSIGMTNTFRVFNNLQLLVFADYQGGHWQWCAICSVRTRLDRNSPEINDPNITAEERGRLLSLQTKEYIYRADFIKLREVSATYSIPQRFVGKAGFKRAALTLSGRNLAIWTKYKGNSDPEVAFNSNAANGSAAFTTTDYAAIPMHRRLMLSMNFNF